MCIAENTEVFISITIIYSSQQLPVNFKKCRLLSKNIYKNLFIKGK